LRFMSRYTRITYVVQSESQIILPNGMKAPGQKAIRAKFTSPDGIPTDSEGNVLEQKEPSFFDSEVAQRTHRWTDEERLQVEAWLLGHKDFGSSLYLAPQQDIPKEHAEIETTLRARGVFGPPPEELVEQVGQAAEKPQCAFIGSDMAQCFRPAKKDSDLCGPHEREVKAAEEKDKAGVA